MAENEGDVLLDTEICDLVPGEHALHSNHDILTEGSNDTEKSFLICVDVLVNPDIASGIEDTDKHSLSVQIDSTIKLVLFGVKSHRSSSF